MWYQIEGFNRGSSFKCIKSSVVVMATAFKYSSITGKNWHVDFSIVIAYLDSTFADSHFQRTTSDAKYKSLVKLE